MTASTTTGLVAWLREQIAADEKAARYNPFEGMSDVELHARCIHPAYEYETTEGPRKAWDHENVPPEGEGWERNRECGRDGWERFDYTEESYWRRLRPDGPREVTGNREALAQCEAHTMLLDSITARLGDADRLEQMGAQPADVSAIRAPAEWQLAVTSLAYQHRPGYQQEWRPQP